MLNHVELVLANVFVNIPCLFMFDILSKHPETMRTKKTISYTVCIKSQLRLIIYIPSCSNLHFSNHDSDKRRLRGGLVKCQKMTMRLLKQQPTIWLNVEKDSTRSSPSAMEGCWGCSWETDTSLAAIRLSSAMKRRNVRATRRARCAPLSV